MSSAARDDKKPDIVRQNSIEALRSLRHRTKRTAMAEVGAFIQEKLRGQCLNLVDMKIAAAGGFSAYLKKARVREFLEEFLVEMEKIGYGWTSHERHSKILEDFEDFGGFGVFPEDLRQRLVLWMVLCYIGEPGGYRMGRSRPVFYSNVAAPLIERFFANGSLIYNDIEQSAKYKLVKAAITDVHIARRWERLRDLADVSRAATGHN